MKTAKNGKKTALTVLFSIVGVLVIASAGAVILTAPGRAELQNMSFADTNFNTLSDGVYTGTYHGTKDSFRDAGVEITVSGGAVTQIRITEGGSAGDKQYTEVRNGLSLNDLFGEVIDAQSLDVDAISGATLTCNAHLKAVENAVEQARKN